MPGRIRQGFRSPSGTPAAIWLSRSHSFGCERVFSRHARVPSGAPCIFGSIQQARVAAYAPDIPYWSQERLQRAVLVGGQTPLGQMGVLRAVPEPKMTSISVTLLSRSGTGRARGAEYSVFCTAQAGVHQGRKEHLSFFMQSATGSMQNAKRKHR